jgi:hypothetical protein
MSRRRMHHRSASPRRRPVHRDGQVTRAACTPPGFESWPSLHEGPIILPLCMCQDGLGINGAVASRTKVSIRPCSHRTTLFSLPVTGSLHPANFFSLSRLSSNGRPSHLPSLSKHLIQASPVFQAALTGGWKESTHRNSDGFYEINYPRHTSPSASHLRFLTDTFRLKCVSWY